MIRGKYSLKDMSGPVGIVDSIAGAEFCVVVHEVIPGAFGVEFEFVTLAVVVRQLTQQPFLCHIRVSVGTFVREVCISLEEEGVQRIDVPGEIGIEIRVELMVALVVLGTGALDIGVLQIVLRVAAGGAPLVEMR